MGQGGLDGVKCPQSGRLQASKAEITPARDEGRRVSEKVFVVFYVYGCLIHIHPLIPSSPFNNCSRVHIVNRGGWVSEVAPARAMRGGRWGFFKEGLGCFIYVCSGPPSFFEATGRLCRLVGTRPAADVMI